MLSQDYLGRFGSSLSLLLINTYYSVLPDERANLKQGEY